MSKALALTKARPLKTIKNDLFIARSALYLINFNYEKKWFFIFERRFGKYSIIQGFVLRLQR